MITAQQTHNTPINNRYTEVMPLPRRLRECEEIHDKLSSVECGSRGAGDGLSGLIFKLVINDRYAVSTIGEAYPSFTPRER